MNQFLQQSKNLINKHGVSMAYTVKTVGTYSPATSTVTNTSTDYTVKMYPKHIKANAYNYPNLVGKDAVLFYLVNDSLDFIPKIMDYINYNGSKYKVDSLQGHFAEGVLILYRIAAVKA